MSYDIISYIYISIFNIIYYAINKSPILLYYLRCGGGGAAGIAPGIACPEPPAL